MSLRHWSIAIQALGSAATVGAALWVAWRMGLPAQGEFALLRSWYDALTTIAVLGLPQGLLHMQYRLAVPVAALRVWVLRYASWLTGVSVLVGLCLILVLCGLAQSTSLAATIVSITVAVPLAAIHLMWRSLALRESGVLAYAAITAAPALLLFAALIPIGLAGWHGAFGWALVVSALGAALMSDFLVRRASGESEAPVEWSRRTLWLVSLETGASSVLSALGPALMLSVAGLFSASLGEVGIVSLGLHFYQLFGIAAAYVAPMVYDRVARPERSVRTDEILAWLRVRPTLPKATLLTAATGLMMLLIRHLWPAGPNALPLFFAMAVTGLLSMVVRLLVTLMLARGVLRPLTYQALGRLAICVAGTAVLTPIATATLAVPVALSMAEVWSLYMLVRLARRTDEAVVQGPRSEHAAS